MKRLYPLLGGAFVLLLPACGFHLREPLQMPPELAGVQVTARSAYSPLKQQLTRMLERAGYDVPEAAGQGVARLQIGSERWESQAISVDQFGRGQEFTLRYAAVFTLFGVDGEEIVPEQVIELSRDYVSLPSNSTGSESEREMLSREMQREMAAAVLRRIDAVNRAREEQEPEPAPMPAAEGGAAAVRDGP